MRRVYALLSLAKKYGDARIDSACAVALSAQMLDLERLQRMLKIGDVKMETPTPRVIPLSRYLRPASQYALPFPTKTGATQ
jgi:hypothetical protein